MSAALESTLGCAKTYVAQFAEAADHPHVHVHVIARQHDQPEEWKGPDIFRHALGVKASEQVPEERRNEIAAAL